MTKTERLNVFRAIHRYRDLVGLRYPQLMLVAGLSLVAGFAQAGLLVVVVRAATALTADTEQISGQIGPLAASDLSIAQLIGLGFLMVGVMFVTQLVATYASASMTTQASLQARVGMLDRFSRASFDTQSARPRWETQFMVLSLPGQASAVVGGMTGLIASVVTFLALTGSALVLSPLAGFIVIAGMAILIVGLQPVNRIRRRLAREQVRLSRANQGHIVARFELAHEARSFGVDEQADAPIRQGLEDQSANSRKMKMASQMAGTGYQLGAYSLMLGMLGLIEAIDAQNLAALTGALLILLRSLSYGQKAFSSYQGLSQQAPVVAEFAEEAAKLRAAQERMGGSHVPRERIGRIEFEHVGFEYVPDQPVLHDVSFTIEHGDFVALVGPTGAGKSTIMQLLLRLREGDTGSISVDGTPMSEISLDWWRSRIGYVAQEPKLLKGSVSDTIRFYRPDISDEAVVEAARRAHIADEIESWSLGFDTDVGQMGENVSGGQRQRIALARAIVTSPDLLLLDEPTDALDPHSERRIAQTLEALRGKTTIVVIAHRFETVQRANKVIVIEGGRVIPHAGDEADALRGFLVEQSA